MRSCAPALLVLALAAGLSSCVEFNECAEDPGARLGSAAVDLDLRESVVRTQEAPVGNLVADGLFGMADFLCQETGLPCPDLAFQNAGGLRQETACGTRDVIEAGAVYEQDIEDLMPFENDLVVIGLTGADVKLALERAVSSLGQVGEAAAAGYFLQVAGVELEVDCRQAPQILSGDQRAVQSPGARVPLESIYITSRNRREPLDLEAEYQVVTNSFIGSGKDGFLSFFFRDEQGRVVEDGDGPVMRLDPVNDVAKDPAGKVMKDRRAVMDWLRAHEEAGLAVGRPPEGRIRIDGSCYGAALPAGG